MLLKQFSLHRIRHAHKIVMGLLIISALPCWAGWLGMPDNVNLQAVGEELRLNGTPMKVRAFTAEVPMETLLKQVQENWQKQVGDKPVDRTKNTNWTVLNQSIGTEHRSFQVRELSATRVEGYVALTSPELTIVPKLVIPLPSDVRTVSIIDSNDAGKVSQQVIAVSPRSVDATVSALESALKTAGWERHVMKKSATVIQFSADRNGQEFDASLSKQKAGTLLMMNTLVQSK